MFTSPLPTDAGEFMRWEWAQIAPYYEELAQYPLSESTVGDWLSSWSYLSKLINETSSRLHLAKTMDTTDEVAEQRFFHFLKTIYPPSQTAEQELKLKLLESGLEPAGMEVPLRKLRVEADIFRQENLPLVTEERRLGTIYDKIIGAQTVEWAGEERTLTQLKPFFHTADRALREQIWRLSSARQLADRESLNDLWTQLLQLRRQQATNAGFNDDYRAYRWQELKRFDYTPEDSKSFHQAIEAVVVPAAQRIYERKRQQLGVERLRPWDVDADVFTLSFPPLRPFDDVAQLDAKAAAIFYRVDPELGAYFDTMRRESLLDLANRKGKAPGGYCTSFPVAKRPFIFMNAVGTAGDVKTLLHEAGHAFHVFEASRLPYVHQLRTGSEFSEVASMSMELLASPYLSADQGGYYVEAAELARHRISHLEKIILFWPYMAVVDAFQHWVYENPEAAGDAANCDAAWSELWQRFVPGVDWTGFEEVIATGWHRKLHIFRAPFYYVEYGMAQVGAIQVWRNALQDQAEALACYRHALSLGGTRTLPELYEAAGARFQFDVPVMQTVVGLLEQTIDELAVRLDANG